MQQIDIIKPGSEIRMDGIVVTVLEVCIKKGDYIQYRVSWWDSRTRNTAWVERFELEKPYLEDLETIGFKNADCRIL